MGGLLKSLLVGMILSGCGQKTAHPTQTPPSPSFLDSLKNRLPSHFSMGELKGHIEGGNLDHASKYINVSLQRSTNNAALHLINGFVYEEMARNGDTSKAELAAIAYRSAYALDPTHWLNAYLLGNHLLKSKQYDKAQEYLAEAMMLNPDYSDVPYSLACASYYLRDLPVALVSIEKALAIAPEKEAIQRSAAIIFAASGQFKKAECAIECYKKLLKGKNSEDIAYVCQRIEDWKNISHRAKTYTVADETVEEASEMGGEDEAAIKNSPSQKPTIILECYLLSVAETTLSNFGNNLLNPRGSDGIYRTLQVILGGPASSPPPLASIRRDLGPVQTISGGPRLRVPGKWVKNFNYQISSSAVNYSLNIANALDTVVTLTARPTVSTLESKSAEFSNSDLISGAVAGGPTLNVDAGVKIEATPLKVAEDGCITLEIVLTSSAFQGNPSQDSKITNQLLALRKAKTATTIKVYPGQTAMVAAMHADSRLTGDTRVPFLGDIPFLQYFFANKNSGSDRRTFLYLVTPRLGGSANQCAKKSLSAPSPIARRLQNKGFSINNFGEYSAMYYILKHLESSPTFSDFQSGDIIAPFWGYGGAPISNKLDMLSSFLYF